MIMTRRASVIATEHAPASDHFDWSWFTMIAKAGDSYHSLEFVRDMLVYLGEG